MIRLQPTILRGIRSANTAAALHDYLQKAVELEHSTIPPYLTAMFSFKRGHNTGIASRIRSIVVQEMLHMTIAANILIAIGGRPAINRRGFIPEYPGTLPMSVGDGVQVGIEAFSMDLVETTFMAIEQPEDEVAVERLAFRADGEEEPEYATIGAFYDAIKAQIMALGPSIFVQRSAPPQVIDSEWFPPAKLFPITSPETACLAIDIIKQEGEGTSANPFESRGDPSHFYKFGEILAGRELVKTATAYAYAGRPIVFDPSGVWPLRPNCRIEDFDVGTLARTRIAQFAYNYGSVLNALQKAFDGHPSELDAAIGVMYDLRVLSVALMQTELGDGSGQTVGPSFQYVQGEGGMQ
jgi:hypothetical protein